MHILEYFLRCYNNIIFSWMEIFELYNVRACVKLSNDFAKTYFSLFVPYVHTTYR